jgi:hypothetical protein
MSIRNLLHRLSIAFVLSGWLIAGLPAVWSPYIPHVEAATTQTFTTSGSWTAPTDVSLVIVEAWGGGGAGGGRGNSSGAAGGGGGGAYASATLSVVAGNTYNYTVGATAAGDKVDGVNGNPSFWDAGAEVYADGGKGGLLAGGGGAGGAVANSIGTTRYAGGDGAAAPGTTSGAGGGGAGSTGAGGNATGATAGTGTTTGGGTGGAGVTNANGNPGATAGGGGSGAQRNNGNRIGGDGAAGQIRITYAIVTVTVADGAIDYGGVQLGSTQNTTASGVNDTQIVTNAGDSAEDINISGQNSTNWTLASAPGSDQFVHAFCTSGSGSPDPCDTAPTWTPLTTSYQPLATNLAVSGTQRFDVRITAPTTTSFLSQQSTSITIQAVMH